MIVNCYERCENYDNDDGPPLSSHLSILHFIAHPWDKQLVLKPNEKEHLSLIQLIPFTASLAPEREINQGHEESNVNLMEGK